MTTHKPIPDSAFREAVAIVGRTGSGKTYAARGVVEALLERGSRLCIVDPTGVWWGLKSSADGTAAGFPVAVFGGKHADVALTESTAGPLAQLLASRNLPAIVDLSELSRAAIYRFATRFFEDLHAHNTEPLTLVIDEADLFAPQRPGKDQLTLLNRVEHIVRRGRVRGFKPFLITQRPAVVHKDVLSQAATLIALKLTAPQDRDAIGDWIEGQADREQGKRVLAELPKLPVGQGFVWCPGADYLERVTFPQIRTFDTGRTPEHGEAAREPVTIAEVDLSDVLAALDEDGQAEDELAPEPLPAARDGRADDEIEREARKRGHAEGYGAALDDIRASLDYALEQLQQHVAGEIEQMRAQLAALGPTRPVPAAPGLALEQPAPAPRKRVNGSASATHAGGELPKAERLILTALAQYPQGRTRTQIALLTGYAVNGGGFRNAVGALRTKGMLVGADQLVITDAGKIALGSWEPLPRGRALLEHWCGQLPKAERKALEALSEVYPRTLSRSQLAHRAGYEAEGGGFRNALGRLRTLELIQGKAEMRASPDFFDRSP